jgi:hypothetical protein
MGCISLFGFVVIAFFVGVATVFGAYHLPLVDAIVLGSLALSGIGLLFVRSWAARGIGMGLLVGWALLTIVSAGTCTGINPGLYGVTYERHAAAGKRHPALRQRVLPRLPRRAPGATAARGRLPGRQRALRRMLAERVVRLTVKPFMDINTMIEERLTQCCVHVGTRGDVGEQCAPFCEVQAWSGLAEQKLPTQAGR